MRGAVLKRRVSWQPNHARSWFWAPTQRPLLSDLNNDLGADQFRRKAAEQHSSARLSRCRDAACIKDGHSLFM